MTSVTFENGTIRDVISKAAKIAPTKGSAFDKAAGIVMVVDPANDQVVVKSTNIEVWYMEIADTLSIEGAPVMWRVPSQILDGIASKLPIASGKTVTFDDSEGRLKIESGRMRARLGLLDPTYFPRWDAFDPEGLEEVSGFGARMDMVQWAAAQQGEPPMTGVHFTGTHVVATDRFKIAIAPCEAPPIYKPVTIPAGIFTPLMKTLGDVAIGVSGGELLVMPDDSTQIRAVIYGHEYPPVINVLKRNEPDSITFKRTSLLECIERAMVMGQRDRTPCLRIIIGKEEIAVFMSDKEVGLLGDVIETPGYAAHKRVTIGFTPGNLTGALNASPNDQVTLHYWSDSPTKPVRLDGGSGYEVLIMPRKDLEES